MTETNLGPDNPAAVY